ncbi:ammonia-forming cytochrome c nitrite reductase subunit c552 [Mariniluteicoccus flavus]
MDEKPDEPGGAAPKGATPAADAKDGGRPKRRLWGIKLLPLAAFLVLGALATVTALALLVNIIQKKEEAKDPWFRVVEQTETTYDPAVWGQNFPLQYQGWKKTNAWPEADKVKQAPTAQDPREWKTPSKLQDDPRLVTMWQGYAFAVEYNEPRGHDWMLSDQQNVKRVTQFKQPGACLNCHASTVEIMRDLGNGDMNAGFDAMNKMPYADATKLAKHPVGCIDCHDPKTMALRVTRPAFINGIKTLKAGQGLKDYDVNKDATPQEMRAFVCASATWSTTSRVTPRR